MPSPALRSSNPALAPERFRDAVGEGHMTVTGTALRTMILLLLVGGSASYTWWQLAPDPAAAGPYIMGGMIGGLVLAMITIFKPHLAPWTAPLYAVTEGLALGALSMLMNIQYAGLPVQAVMLTLAVFLGMLALYAFRIIRVTERFRAIMVGAIFGIMLFYLGQMLLGFFGVTFPGVNGGGTLGIGISIITAGVAALSLLLDFDRIEQASAAGAPKMMEWYGAFGLIVTLVWLYIELLNLLRKMRD